MHYLWILGNLTKTGIINNSSDAFEIGVITGSYNNFERKGLHKTSKCLLPYLNWFSPFILRFKLSVLLFKLLLGTKLVFV